MIDYLLNEVEITSSIPREFIEKILLLSEHNWSSFDKIPKVGLLPHKNIEADLLCITLNHELAMIFITEYPVGGMFILQLARYYKFSFKLNYYSVFSMCQGTFEYDHVLDKETAFGVFQWDYSGKISYDEHSLTYTYENTAFKWKEELMDYLYNQKIRDEKLDIALGNKVFSFVESLPTPKGNVIKLSIKQPF